MDKILSRIVLVFGVLFILSGCGGGSDGSVTNPGISGQPNNSSCFDFSKIVNGSNLTTINSYWSCTAISGNETARFSFVISADGAGLTSPTPTTGPTESFIWGVSTCDEIVDDSGEKFTNFQHIATSGILTFDGQFTDGSADVSCFIQAI